MTPHVSHCIIQYCDDFPTFHNLIQHHAAMRKEAGAYCTKTSKTLGPVCLVVQQEPIQVQHELPPVQQINNIIKQVVCSSKARNELFEHSVGNKSGLAYRLEKHGKATGQHRRTCVATTCYTSASMDASQQSQRLMHLPALCLPKPYKWLIPTMKCLSGTNLSI